MNRAVVIISCLLLLFASEAQNRKYLSVTTTPGFLLAHRADIKNLAAHNWGVEVSYELDRTNTKWGSHYRTPTIGFGALYYNFGSSITGHAFGGITHMKFGVLRTKKMDVRLRMGAGIAYLTEKFNPYENRRNQAIGSNLNGTMQFGLLGHFDLPKKDYLELGISITHYSNAAFKVPNLGYNIPSITVRYGLGVGEDEPLEESEEELSKWEYRGTFIYGKKQRNFAAPQDFYNFGIQLRAMYNLSEVKAWRMGVDYTSDKTYKYSEDPFYPLDSISFLQKSEVAIAGGFQWSFGKVDVIAEMGAYLYKPAVLKNALSQRMGLAYRVTPHLSTQGTLRFHRGVADFFEIGLGYTL
ncbi:MAG: acyloxyacyl hydrolase [Bacteroidia bacterium]